MQLFNPRFMKSKTTVISFHFITCEDVSMSSQNTICELFFNIQEINRSCILREIIFILFIFSTQYFNYDILFNYFEKHVNWAFANNFDFLFNSVMRSK